LVREEVEEALYSAKIFDDGKSQETISKKKKWKTEDAILNRDTFFRWGLIEASKFLFCKPEEDRE
jgi:hypothetical protein